MNDFTRLSSSRLSLFYYHSLTLTCDIFSQLATADSSENCTQSNGCMDIDEQPVVNVDKTTENMDIDSPPLGNVTDLKLKLLSQDSRPGTPVDGSFASTPTSSQTPQAINPCVRILAKAVLEVRSLTSVSTICTLIFKKLVSTAIPPVMHRFFTTRTLATTATRQKQLNTFLYTVTTQKPSGPQSNNLLTTSRNDNYN